MENTPMVDEVIVPKKNILFEVTTLSKTLAAILFIILPFVGFWVGYNYDSTAKVAENTVLNTGIISNENEEIITTKPSLVRLAKEVVKSTVVSIEPLGSYIQKMDLDPVIVKDVRAKENQDKIDAGGWYQLANGYIDEETLFNSLGYRDISKENRPIWLEKSYGSGYYGTRGNDFMDSILLRHIYGTGSYIVHSSIVGLGRDYNVTSFELLYSGDGSDLIQTELEVPVNDGETWETNKTSKILVRNGESWEFVPALEGKRVRFITTILNELENNVFYFTDEENVYAMYGRRAYEGCCTIMTDNMFKVLGADLSSFEIVDKSTARDKNNDYTATMFEKGGIELIISARQ